MKKYFFKMFNNSKLEFFNLIKLNVVNNKKMFIITANPETLMIAKKDKKFEDILMNQKVTIVPDGIGIIKGAKILKINLKERIPGIDIAKKLLELANDYKKSIYVLGATQKTLNAFAIKIKQKYKNLEVISMKNGYDYKRDEIFQDILIKRPDIIFVALGIPYQEELIDKYYNKANKGIFIGVGGSIDVLSGIKKRAPKIFIKTNLEWLYRIIKEPTRLKRFYNNNIKFMLKLKKEK